MDEHTRREPVVATVNMPHRLTKAAARGPKQKENEKYQGVPKTGCTAVAFLVTDILCTLIKRNTQQDSENAKGFSKELFSQAFNGDHNTFDDWKTKEVLFI